MRFLLLCVLFCGCSDEGVVIAFDGPEELAPMLDTIELLLSSDTFTDLTDAQDFVVVDADQDGQKDLLYTMDVSGRTTLPVLRLDPGSFGEATIGLSARALKEDAVIALGDLPARVLFQAGELVTVTLTLQLVRERQPPRLVAITPQALPSGSLLSSVAFFASKPLKPESLTGHVQVILTDQTDTTVSGSVRSVPCPFATEMWIFEPDQCHTAASNFSRVRLVIDPAVTDQEGNPLQGEAVDLALEISGFGPCTPTTHCNRLGRSGERHEIDVLCNQSTGLLEPAQCSIAAGGCSPLDTFSYVRDDNCAAYRPGSTSHGGFCLATDHWDCANTSDCVGASAHHCNNASGYCNPASCTDTCSSDALACAPEGCLPKIGGCI